MNLPKLELFSLRECVKKMTVMRFDGSDDVSKKAEKKRRVAKVMNMDFKSQQK